MDKKWTAEELFNAIKNMENGERWKFLEMMYDEFYDTSHLTPEAKTDDDLKLTAAFLKHKIIQIEKDVEELKRERKK